MAKMTVTYDWTRVRKELFDNLAEEQTKRLIAYAKEALQQAYNQRGFKNDTFNLLDSYVWAVYYKGSLKDYGGLTDTQLAQEPADFEGQGIYGKDEAQRFVNAYSPKTAKGWDMVIAATVPYAYKLEAEERGIPRRKFEVISTVYDDLVQDFAGYGKVTKINL